MLCDYSRHSAWSYYHLELGIVNNNKIVVRISFFTEQVVFAFLICVDIIYVIWVKLKMSIKSYNGM